MRKSLETMRVYTHRACHDGESGHKPGDVRFSYAVQV